MKQIKSIDLGKAAIYGAVLAALWTFLFGLYYWIAGWMFGAQAWFIDMNLGIWTEFTLQTMLSVIWRMVLNGVGGAFAAFFAALVYNFVAAVMGGIVITVEDAK